MPNFTNLIKIRFLGFFDLHSEESEINQSVMFWGHLKFEYNDKFNQSLFSEICKIIKEKDHVPCFVFYIHL